MRRGRRRARRGERQILRSRAQHPRHLVRTLQSSGNQGAHHARHYTTRQESWAQVFRTGPSLFIVLIVLHLVRITECASNHSIGCSRTEIVCRAN